VIRDQNTLDCTILEPGDILMVANPTDVPIIRYLIFWSHVGIVGLDSTQVIDAVREPRGEWTGEPAWYQVRRGPVSSYLLSYDILAIRPRLAAVARSAAAEYAESKVGLPYAPTVRRILYGRRDTSAYSCASLMWQAYERQGLDLAPIAASSGLNVVPLVLARSPHVDVIGRGTRYGSMRAQARRLRAQRWWFRHALGADIVGLGREDSPGDPARESAI
jgi:uncharacterized protein YycO